jgi:hypothetical protein
MFAAKEYRGYKASFPVFKAPPYRMPASDWERQNGYEDEEGCWRTIGIRKGEKERMPTVSVYLLLKAVREGIDSALGG